jgi:hypothetical protein
VVNASNDSSTTSDTAVLSASNAATISSRVFEDMFEYYAVPLTENRSPKPLGPK